MPRRQFIDPKSAQRFTLVHRSQNDPLINDPDAPSQIFTEQAPTQAKKKKKVKERGDLEEEFGLSIRPNEGEAASHGVYYDDSQYDYMQHMRDLGQGSGEGFFVEAPTTRQKGKGKTRLEDALAAASLEDDDLHSQPGTATSLRRGKSLLGDEQGSERKTTYQDQQDVPDAIAGFQPDMDPRLREVLEALEDEAYVDDEEDIFAELAQEGQEVNKDEWEAMVAGDADGEDGWESDETEKPSQEYRDTGVSHFMRATEDQSSQRLPPDTTSIPIENSAIPAVDALNAPIPADPTAGAWLDEYHAFKSANKQPSAVFQAPKDPQRVAPSTVLTATSLLSTGRRKKRKGALTDTSSYSMTSSALQRTTQQTLLDARFDKIEEEYAEDGIDEDGQFEDAETSSMISGATGLSAFSGVSGATGASGVSATSRSSRAPNLVPTQRSDFDGIMDDFLGSYGATGKKGRVKKGGKQTGMEQLDEVRRGLGPARISSRART